MTWITITFVSGFIGVLVGMLRHYYKKTESLKELIGDLHDAKDEAEREYWKYKDRFEALSDINKSLESRHLDLLKDYKIKCGIYDESTEVDEKTDPIDTTLLDWISK